MVQTILMGHTAFTVKLPLRSINASNASCIHLIRHLVVLPDMSLATTAPKLQVKKTKQLKTCILLFHKLYYAEDI